VGDSGYQSLTVAHETEPEDGSKARDIRVPKQQVFDFYYFDFYYFYRPLRRP
jgi:hypothetical protein